MTADLFDVEPFRAAPAPATETLSADRRRTQRQAQALALRSHPLALAAGYPIRLHEDAAPGEDRTTPGRRCGTCRWRQVLGYHNRAYPKCVFPDGLSADQYEQNGPPRVSHGAGTDVRRWWPGCEDHEYGDPKLSPDAARCVPEAVTA